MFHSPQESGRAVDNNFKSDINIFSTLEFFEDL